MPCNLSSLPNARILVTGGAGFIGSALCRYLVGELGATVLNVDALTYAANLESLAPIHESARYTFSKSTICDATEMTRVFNEFKPTAVMHLAAESHVDRSIDAPDAFLQTNIMGTYTLLQAALAYYRGLHEGPKECFRFLHVSTDEVYGTLGDSGLFTEETPYAPNSPYSASKASSDLLVRAWHHTYGLPVVTTNCSNNYGPYHFPEKLIPLVILNAIHGRELPVYGEGLQIRDWLYVEDHARALVEVLLGGRLGETYNIGGHNEQTNIHVVNTICALLDELHPRDDKQPYAEQITYVTDRPGHDRRYAIDASKIQRELGWVPQETFESGLKKTVQWYLDNKDWWEPILAGKYSGERLGVLK